MEWALTILVGAAMLLLVLSFYNNKQVRKAEERGIEQFSITIMKEVQQLEKQIRKVELDTEIIKKETGIQVSSSSENSLLQEVFDLYKSGYSIEGIAAEKKVTENEVALMLAPFMEKSVERRNVANGS
ncbi:hypothetical protein BKP45_06315 [Anaerobacillus alkalidiazotrophicus]|uniref:Resolvase HTH domain-containing protein n=2 Tax=Anaerobacillus alkalidiazotrophicus TaxID=472963 RepID=A0A1S2MCW8_9BACI|nr:hypothetical protein BKP45_06315 [Anaerobacillus alkalidiazotrophicus]